MDHHELDPRRPLLRTAAELINYTLAYFPRLPLPDRSCRVDLILSSAALHIWHPRCGVCSPCIVHLALACEAAQVNGGQMSR